VTSETFRSDYDLSVYLSQKRRGDWKEDLKKKYPEWRFLKRFGGVWFEISGRDLGFNGYVYIRPTVGQIPMDIEMIGEDSPYKAYNEATYRHMDVQGMTYADVESVITDQLLPAYKRFTAPYRQRERESREAKRAAATWEEYEGKEAIQKWAESAEELILRTFGEWGRSYVEMTEYGREYGHKPERKFFKTGDLFNFIIAKNTGSYELGWPSGLSERWARRALPVILAKLEERKLILSGRDWGEEGAWTFEEKNL
jgi:hypothetical protein